MGKDCADRPIRWGVLYRASAGATKRAEHRSPPSARFASVGSNEYNHGVGVELDRQAIFGSFQSMSDYQSVRSAAAALSIADQLRLIDEIAASMPADQPPSLSEEWLAELERRSAEIDSGTAQTEPWATIRQRLLEVGS